MTERMILADCLLAMSEMEPESIASVCTDPPYGLKFMGKLWDHGVPGEPYWREVLRVLKPGGHLVAFGGTRTHHRLMVAIEDAGFEIRDTLMWLHGQGFPKGKGCLKPAWEPIVLARKPAPAPWLNIDGCRLGDGANKGVWLITDRRSTRRAMSGSLGAVGTNLSSGRWPANVVLSHAECREVGTKRVSSATGGSDAPGALGRMNDDAWQPKRRIRPGYADADGYETTAVWECVAECAVRLLDEQSGERKPSGIYQNVGQGTGGGSTYMTVKPTGAMYADTGGASRFFATFPSESTCASVNTVETSSSPSNVPVDSAHDPVRAKPNHGSECLVPSMSETLSVFDQNDAGATPATPNTEPRFSLESPRTSIAQTIRANDAAPLGLTDITTTTGSHSTSGICVGPAISNTTRGNSEPGAAVLPIDIEGTPRFRYCAKTSPKERGVYNDHPTVKPLALMRWLVRLVTPPGGVVLDPFCGSGSTLLAARDEGFDAIGIDNDPHAFDITRKRLGHEEAPVSIVDDRVRILAVRRQPREAVREQSV